MTGTGLHVYLSYRDAPAALQWLEATGFATVARHDAPDGVVAHAEVRRGNAVLMVATADADYETPALKGRSTGDGLYLWMDEPEQVEAWHRAALEAGASDVISPEQTEWGTVRARVLDPEGKEWSAGTYRPGTTAW